MTTMRMAAGALALLFLSCGGCKKDPQAAAGVGSAGAKVAGGRASDLRVSPDGRFGLYLVDAEKPRLNGVPPQMVLGELHGAPLTGGSAKKLANGVTNVPGGYLFSPDSRWALALAGYNPAAQAGELVAINLSSPGMETRRLGADVTYMLVAPDSKEAAFVEDGVLKRVPLEGGDARQVAGEVTTAQYSPDGKWLFFKRRLSAAGGLYAVSLAKDGAEPVRLADQVGDYAISPDSRFVALAQRSEVVHSTYDLLFATLPALKPVKLANGTGGFAFSPDGKYFARTENARPEVLGDLFVGPASGGAGRKVGERVQEFSFSPDSVALAYLEHYDISARAGLVGVAQLPDGKPKRVGSRSPNYAWGADGRYLAFLSRFLKPVFSVDLMLYPVGEEEAFKVQQGVFGYGFGPKNEALFYRSNCIRNGRACELFRLDLAKPKEPGKQVVQGIYSFKLSDDGARMMVTYARTENETFDVAVVDLSSGNRRTVEQYITLPAVFLDAQGENLAYVVNDSERSGVYVAQSPLKQQL